MARRGQIALFAVAILSLAVLEYFYVVTSSRVSMSYHGEAEWMILLATARHSLAMGLELDTLMDRLGNAASRQGVWIPPVEWSVSSGSNGSGWFYRAVFYNTSLPGFEGWFYANASYSFVGSEYDEENNLWLVYNLTYLHEYRLPQYSYSITIYPEPLNTTCSRVYRVGEGEWIAKLNPPCTLKDKWGIKIISVGGG